jgi:hypothetical protein
MFEILSVVLIYVLCVLLLIVLFIASTFLFCHKSLFFAKLYAMLFEKDDYKVYLEVKEYLKNNRIQLVPSIQLSTSQVYNDDLIDKWIFAVFENYDVAIYDNSYELCLTNFHNKLMEDLLKDAGYTLDNIRRVAEEGEIRSQQLLRELEESRKELEKLEAELKQLNK